jgi:hypothetical protein
MDEPAPGKLQRQGTLLSFASVVQKAFAVQKFTSAMMRRIRWKRENGGQPLHATAEMTPLTPQPLSSDDSIPDVSWDDVAKEVQTDGDKHVLVYFYSPRVWSFY